MTTSSPSKLTRISFALFALIAIAACGKKEQPAPEFYIVPSDVIYDAPDADETPALEDIPEDFVGE